MVESREQLKWRLNRVGDCDELGGGVDGSCTSAEWKTTGFTGKYPAVLGSVSGVPRKKKKKERKKSKMTYSVHR